MNSVRSIIGRSCLSTLSKMSVPHRNDAAKEDFGKIWAEFRESEIVHLEDEDVVLVLVLQVEPLFPSKENDLPSLLDLTLDKRENAGVILLANHMIEE